MSRDVAFKHLACQSFSHNIAGMKNTIRHAILLGFAIASSTASYAAIDWSRPIAVIDCEVKATKPLDYPVIEEPWRQMIMRKLQENLPLAQKKIEEARRKILNGEIQYRPKAVNLPVASTRSERAVELRYTLTHDIIKRNGEVLYAKGTVVEPLKAMRLSRFYYIGTEDQILDDIDAAVEEARSHGALLTVLCTKGDVISLVKTLSDEFGPTLKVYMATEELMDRLRVTKTPSLIHQEGHRLIIVEAPFSSPAKPNNP